MFGYLISFQESGNGWMTGNEGERDATHFCGRILKGDVGAYGQRINS